MTVQVPLDRPDADLPFDLTAIKRVDSFSNPEVRFRIPILVVSGAIASWLMGDPSLMVIILCYELSFAVQVYYTGRLPARVGLWRFVSVVVFGTLTHAALMSISIYMFAHPDRGAQFVGLALFFSLSLNTISQRAREPTLFSTDLWALCIAVVVMIWVEVSRNANMAEVAVIATTLVALCIYTVSCTLEIGRFRKGFDAAREGQRAADKQRAIGQLTGGVAHDFNNLLTVVLGNLELRRHVTDPVEHEALLQEAEAAAQRGADLTSQLLAFSRRSNLSVRPATVSEICEGISPFMIRLLGERHQLACGHTDGLARINVDVGKLQSVLLNLVLNARDALPDGGVVHFFAQSTDALDVATVTLTVQDQGTGISSADLAHVFEPFFTTKPVGKGSGLGLSMAKGFVEQSGGRLDLTSREGAGTTVVLHFPALPD